MRRIHSFLALVAIVGSAAASAVLAAPASAQTGYPIGPCPPGTPTSGSQDAGSHPIGSSFTVTLAPVCVWEPGTAVSVVANGQAAGTKVANASGFASVSVGISGSPGAVQLSINPTVAGQCGTNTITASGHSSVANGTVTQSANFNVVCPGGPTASKGGLAFTGANLMRWGAIAAVLIGLGTFLVLARRRRSPNPVG